MYAIARIEQLLKQAILLLERRGYDYKATDLRIRLLELMEAPTLETKQLVAASLEEVFGRLHSFQEVAFQGSLSHKDLRGSDPGPSESIMQSWYEETFDRLYTAVTGEELPPGPLVSVRALRLLHHERGTKRRSEEIGAEGWRLPRPEILKA